MIDNGPDRALPEVTRKVDYYNLDAILSVGYRVNSKRGTQFRIGPPSCCASTFSRGYTLSERRRREKGRGETEQAVGLLARPSNATSSSRARAGPCWTLSTGTRARGRPAERAGGGVSHQTAETIAQSFPSIIGVFQFEEE